MTKKEAAQLLAILKAAYPYSYKGLTEQEAMGVISVWTIQFGDIPADIVHMALQKAISVSKFPPTISEVKQKIESLHWEAYEILFNPMRDESNHPLPEGKRKALKRIYDETREYRNSRGWEPDLDHMLMESGEIGKLTGGQMNG